MPRRVASVLLASSLLATFQTAACPLAQAAGPFPEVVMERAPDRSHLLAYVAMAAGAGLIGASFGLADQGNDTYDAYLASTDPARIDDLFDDTERYDRLASGTLIAGELLVATGLYLRFLRRPAPVRVALGASRCAVAVRF